MWPLSISDVCPYWHQEELGYAHPSVSSIHCPTMCKYEVFSVNTLVCWVDCISLRMHFSCRYILFDLPHPSLFGVNPICVSGMMEPPLEDGRLLPVLLWDIPVEYPYWHQKMNCSLLICLEYQQHDLMDTASRGLLELLFLGVTQWSYSSPLILLSDMQQN